MAGEDDKNAGASWSFYSSWLRYFGATCLGPKWCLHWLCPVLLTTDGDKDPRRVAGGAGRYPSLEASLPYPTGVEQACPMLFYLRV